jgi:hypothetical protein
MSPREALGKGTDAFFSDVSSKESEVISQEPRIEAQYSKVMTKKPRVRSKESKVRSQEPSAMSNDSAVITHKSEINTKESIVSSKKSKVGIIDSEVLTEAISEAQENPRISLWSPLVMSILRYKQLTTYRFSMSREASTALEEAFREKYPELSKQVEKALAER